MRIDNCFVKGLAIAGLLTPMAFGFAPDWLSSTGSGTGACTRSAPCAPFEEALAASAPGEETDVADRADYGVAFIDQSLTIDGGGMGLATMTKSVIEGFSTDPSAVRAILPSAQLAVYLSAGDNQPTAPVERMKRELSALMRTAGFRVVWGDLRAPDPSGHEYYLVVLELRGMCGMPAGNYRMEPSVRSSARLAETVVSEDGVLPFSWVNCANLTHMIGPALAPEAASRRTYFYGRAMARLAAHEIYHIMMGSRDHGLEGVAKSQFTVGDLLDESFGFDAVSLARMRKKAELMPAPRFDGVGPAARR